jgi:hypothetical protein
MATELQANGDSLRMTYEGSSGITLGIEDARGMPLFEAQNVIFYPVSPGSRPVSTDPSIVSREWNEDIGSLVMHPRSLEPGEYRVSAYLEGFGWGETEFRVVAGQITPVSLRFPIDVPQIGERHSEPK